MGPDGHKVEEGGVDVDFMGRRIRVKEGIARLAQSLARVLPREPGPHDHLPVVRAEAEEEPAVGEIVDGGRGQCEHHGVAEEDVRDPGADRDARGPSGHAGDGRERVVATHSLHHEHAVEPALLGEDGQVHRLPHASCKSPHRQPDLHVSPFASTPAGHASGRF